MKNERVTPKNLYSSPDMQIVETIEDVIMSSMIKFDNGCEIGVFDRMWGGLGNG